MIDFSKKIIYFMCMKKKHFLFISILITIFTLTGCGHAKNNSVPRSYTPTTKLAYNIQSTPTLFFHGAMSSSKSEENMVQAAQAAGFSNSVVKVDVNADGQPTLHGTIPKNATNPLIMVNYKNNIQLNYDKAAKYAGNVAKLLKEKYGVSKINMVGHSLGNMSILYYLKNYDNNSAYPRLHKIVTIAAPVMGVKYSNLPESIAQPHNLEIINGKPNEMNSSYRKLLGLRDKNLKQLQVLNIIGETKNGTDGVVENVSSESLGYLMQYAGSYQLMTFRGYYAEHGRLTFNPQVEKNINNFLWGTNS